MLNKNIESIKKECENAVIVAATKNHNANELKELLTFGINNFGENRVDEFLEKYELLKNEDITWHFIGHLQTNKVSKMINKISYLHSLDSLHLAKYIEKYRIEPLNCFIEIKFGKKTNKFGVDIDNVMDVLEEIKKYPTIKICGLMYMNEEDESDEEKAFNFKRLSLLEDKLKLNGYNNIEYLSMGMSNDYKIALQCGSTHVRLGRILWEGMI